MKRSTFWIGVVAGFIGSRTITIDGLFAPIAVTALVYIVGMYAAQELAT